MDSKSFLYRSSSDSEADMHLPHAKDFNTRSRKRNILVVACVFLVTLSLAGILVSLLWTPYSWRLASPISSTNSSAEVIVPLPSALTALDPWDPRLALNGPPTAQFRDNIKPEVRYITSWPAAGWTNDVMTYVNMIYLGFITDRVPIVPMFTPSHINIGAGTPVPTIAFGDVFDVPRLRTLTGRTVLEWRDVKDPQSESVDEIGCWNVWEAVQYHENFPRRSSVPDHLKLDISYTKAPAWVKLIPDFEHDAHATFSSLMRLSFPQALHDNNLLVTPLPSPLHGVSLPPDEHLVCFDYLYYLCEQQPYEYDTDYSPAWRYVAQHMHWVPSIEKLANEYINRALGLPDDAETPPYIGIHVRHYDFAGWCGETPLDECFASISVISRRVREVQEQIQQEKGITVNNVVMTSDEQNATWWQEVRDQGWSIPDHSRTKELYGHWHPVLIDAAIQSGGVGFVGTDRSTMSIMAKRRVEAWQDGATRLVKWGYLGADDH